MLYRTTTTLTNTGWRVGVELWKPAKLPIEFGSITSNATRLQEPLVSSLIIFFHKKKKKIINHSQPLAEKTHCIELCLVAK